MVACDDTNGISFITSLHHPLPYNPPLSLIHSTVHGGVHSHPRRRIEVRSSAQAHLRSLDHPFLRTNVQACRRRGPFSPLPSTSHLFAVVKVRVHTSSNAPSSTYSYGEARAFHTKHHYTRWLPTAPHRPGRGRGPSKVFSARCASSSITLITLVPQFEHCLYEDGCPSTLHPYRRPRSQNLSDRSSRLVHLRRLQSAFRRRSHLRKCRLIFASHCCPHNLGATLLDIASYITRLHVTSASSAFNKREETLGGLRPSYEQAWLPRQNLCWHRQ